MYGNMVGSRVLTGGTTLVPVGFGGRVFNINFLTSGTNIAIKFYTGGSGVTLVLQEDNTGTDKPKTVDYGIQGHEFSNGVYYYPVSGVTQATVSFKKEQSNTGG